MCSAILLPPALCAKLSSRVFFREFVGTPPKNRIFTGNRLCVSRKLHKLGTTTGGGAHANFEPMATTLTTTGFFPNLSFSYEFPIENDVQLYSSSAKSYYKEQSRHVDNEQSGQSPLMVIHVCKNTACTKKVVLKDNLRHLTYVSLHCRIMFPNSVTPREGIIQLVKEGEQDCHVINHDDFFVAVRGRAMSHFTTKNADTSAHLLYSESNSLAFYGKGQPGSKSATKLHEFAYDFFVKQALLVPVLTLEVSLMKISIRLSTLAVSGYVESRMFHVGDLFIRTEQGILAMYRNTASSKKRKLSEKSEECAEVGRPVLNHLEVSTCDLLDLLQYAVENTG